MMIPVRAHGRSLLRGLRGERGVVAAMLLAIVIAAVAVWVAIVLTTTAVRRTAAQDDLLARVRLDAAISHLYLEEYLSGDNTRQTRRAATEAIGRAQRGCAVALRGGRYEGTLVRPVNGDLKGQVAQFCRGITVLATASADRISAGSSSGPGSTADVRYDALFDGLQRQAEALDEQLSDSQEANRRWRTIIGWGVVVLLLALFGGVLRLVRAHGAALRRLTRQNERILTAAGEGIFSVDRRGIAVQVNPATAELTGYSAEEFLGSRVHDLTHHHRADGSPYPFDECPIHASFSGGGPRRVTDEVFWRKDGTSFPVEYTSTPIEEDGSVEGSVVVFTDVSDRRETERLKDEFTSVVSHELRTPLTSIRGSLGLLAGGALGEIPERGQRMLDIAVANTDRLVRLINDILDIERMESGHVEMARVDCDARELVAHAVEMIRPVAAEAGVVLETDVAPAAVYADPDRIGQTLTNLLSNAVKFSPEGGVVRVEVTSRDGEATFCVRDHGRGIPADKLDTIFERFEQVDASDARDKGGTGLGLAICRSIVVQHDGRIWVTSEPGAGSAFFFTLPMAADSMPTPPEQPDRPTVLICDDDPSVRQVMKAMLEEHGYRVVPAASGPHAIELALRERPDVVLLDLLMPGEDGWKTAHTLRERPETAAIPIVAVTVLPPEEAIRDGDLDDYVQKPLDEAKLSAALDRALLRASGHETALVVEDDLDLGRILCTTLEGFGLRCEHARDGNEAIECAGRLRPDIVLLDLGLPGADGFAVVDALRRDEASQAVALVVYTARNLMEDDRERLRLGEHTEFIVKGDVAPSEVGRRVLDLLRRITTSTGAGEG